LKRALLTLIPFLTILTKLTIMKTIIFTLTAVLCILSAKAQKSDTLKGLEADTLIFTSVEKEPGFPGGTTQLNRFLAKTIRYPAAAYQNNTQGRVIIAMIVEKDGSLSQIRVVRVSAARPFKVSLFWAFADKINTKPLNINSNLFITIHLKAKKLKVLHCTP